MKRYEPIVKDGIVICRNCGKTWSNHTMDGHCVTETPRRPAWLDRAGKDLTGNVRSDRS